MEYEKPMIRFKQFLINESIGDVYRSVALHTKKIEPDFSNAIRYQDHDAAAHAYKNAPSENKRRIDSVLKDHSHYHDVHEMFHTHMANMDKKKPKEEKNNAADQMKVGTKQHFIHHNFMAYHKYQQALAEGHYTHKGGKLFDEYIKHSKQILDNYQHSPKGDVATIFNDAWQIGIQHVNNAGIHSNELGILHDHYFK